MRNNAKIKIIRKRNLKTVKKVVKNESRVKQEAARKMVYNVSSWVTEFQKRKCGETKQAIESLFQGRPQTDGV